MLPSHAVLKTAIFCMFSISKSCGMAFEKDHWLISGLCWLDFERLLYADTLFSPRDGFRMIEN